MTFCTKYLDHARKFAPNTYQEKNSLTRRLIKLLGANCIVSAITPEQISDYLNSRALLGDKKEKGREKGQKLADTNNCYNRDRKNLLAMWNWGIKILDDMQDLSNPVAKLDKRPHDRKSQYVPPPADILKALAAATAEERVFLNCYLHTGARRSEIFRLTWAEDINFERRMIRLGSRKNRDGSMVYEWLPMSNELHDSLFWWYKNRPVKNAMHVFVVPDKHHKNFGKPYTTRRWILKAICDRAGVKEFHYHALRRFVASVLADTHKVSSKTIQRILRHQNLHTTELYIKNLNSDLSATMNLLSRISENESENQKSEPV